MKKKALLEIVNKVLEKKDMPSISEISPEQTLREDLNFDSLDLAELTVRIEDHFGVDIFANGIVRTVGDILGLLP